MKVIKKVFKYLAYSLLSILVLFSIYTVIATKVFKQDYVKILGHTYFVVASGSMSGTIELNDIIVVKLNDSYEKDDIITFKKDDSYITHRVVRVEEEKVITRGDTNNLEDDPVSKKDVVGRVVFVISMFNLLKLAILVVFIVIIVVVANFDKIFNKYIVKDKKKVKAKNKTPLEFTQKIKIDKNSGIPLIDGQNDDVEVLELDDEKEFLNLVLKMLKIKNKGLKLTKEGSLKLKYVYELTTIIMLDPVELNNCLKNTPFDELYNYDFEDISFTKNIQDKLYEMPLYIYLKLLSYSLLYDENEFFDAVFKVLKYRIKIDRDQKFIKDTKKLTEVLSLIEKIIINVGHEEDFELRGIREKVKINKAIRNIKLEETKNLKLHETSTLITITKEMVQKHEEKIQVKSKLNCPHCGGKIPNPTFKRCPHCGGEIK